MFIILSFIFQVKTPIDPFILTMKFWSLFNVDSLWLAFSLIPIILG